MRWIQTTLLVFVLGAGHAVAEEQPAPKPGEGLDLIERGTRQLFDDFLQRMDPALKSLERELGPALDAMREKIGDLSAYHAPEVLPNGDIIIRRKTPLEAPVPDAAPTAPAPGDQDIEL